MTKRRTVLLMSVLLVLLLTPAIASGLRESHPEAITVRLLASFDQFGERTFVAKDKGGEEVVFAAGWDTQSSWPIAALEKGDYLEVVIDDFYASEIRWITPLVTTGAFALDIELESPTALESLEERFSYTYGYLMLQQVAQQGLFFESGYYTLGVLHGWTDFFALEEPVGFFAMEELFEAVETYEEEVWSVGNQLQSFIGDWNSVEEVAELAKPTDLEEIYSYAYGYVLTLNLLSQGISVDQELYALGGLDFARRAEPLLSEMEMQLSLFEFQQEMEAEYQTWLALLAEENLAVAEMYLEANRENEGVITTDSGLQYVVLEAGDGPMPTYEDTVEVHYQLQLLDGSIVDSSYQRGESAHFPLAVIIEGFKEAVSLMPVGSTVRAWVHPSLGYGAQANEVIPPNSLLIFDIQLLGIDAE